METTRGLKIERMEGKTELAREVELKITMRVVDEFKRSHFFGLGLSDLMAWLDEEIGKEQGRKNERSN